jgi:hypothetical protein
VESVAAIPLDRGSPATAEILRAALSRPDEIVAVERIEQLAKSLWPDVLSPGGCVGGTAALACGEFFWRLGFFFKYKPYGVKIASPFGYSLFDLTDGEGFSFQVHMEPKIEAFHILRAKPHSLVYISSREEWGSGGAEWAKRATAGEDVADPPFVWRPAAGDVVAIGETGIVHAALGCVLEEYASCSVDAVERLFDQNTRHNLVLPEQHTDAARLLRDNHPGQPVRCLTRTADGWWSRPLSERAPIIEAADDMYGERVRLKQGAAYRLEPCDEALMLIVAVNSPVTIQVADRVWDVGQGEYGCIPPGLAPTVTAPRDCSVAIHRVSRALINANWSR